MGNVVYKRTTGTRFYPDHVVGIRNKIWED